MKTIFEKKSAVMGEIGIVFLSWKRFLSQKMLPHNITLKQFYVLRQLQKKSVLYPAQVADMLFCDRPTATVIISNMEKQGWVERNKDPNNRKWIRITMTNLGKLKLLSIPEDTHEMEKMDIDPLEDLSEEDIDALLKVLLKISSKIRQTREV